MNGKPYPYKRPFTNGKRLIGAYACENLVPFEVLEPLDEATVEEVAREAGIILPHDDDNGGLHG